jgi:hypothetical protein
MSLSPARRDRPLSDSFNFFTSSYRSSGPRPPGGNVSSLDHVRILCAAIREKVAAERSTPVADPTIPKMLHHPHTAPPRRRVIVRFDLLQGLEMLGGATAHALAFGERYSPMVTS